MFQYYRVCTAVPDLKVCDVDYNLQQMIEKIDEAIKQDVKLIVFPELSLTGYTCGDLFLQEILLKKCKEACQKLVSYSKNLDLVILFGMPLMLGYQLYNVAVVCYQGEICGVNVKTFLPNYNEFYEKRWFSQACDLDVDEISSYEVLGDYGEDEYYIPIGNDLIYQLENGASFGIEICEDLWAPLTPSTFMALNGALMIFNLSASNDTIGKRDYRRNLVKSKSQTLMCEYIYTSSGCNESSTDLVFSGHSIIAENGRILKENDKIVDNNYIMVTDLDLERVSKDRLKGKTFKDSYRIYNSIAPIRQIKLRHTSNSVDGFESDGTLYPVDAHPFIPASKEKRLQRCKDIFEMQVAGLAKRISVTNAKLVIGVSGGMDSTLALLVGSQTLRKLNRPLTDLVGITMPAFGTTDRTYQNSLTLMKTLGITVKTIPIKDACIKHLSDIGHDANVKDITYENVQARERTQVLMDYANKIGALVVGTGDLSELALGWCTYNADQMSMYGVNASIPKTLVRWLIDSVIEYHLFPGSEDVLRDILDTPISPELLPPDENGNIVQKTEDSVGPYELHDFFLYYVMRYGYAPKKIFYLAKRAFSDIYSEDIIKKWMKMFYQRFFTQQFKRSCMPDGVKVGSVCLSPRGDWRMPSDAASAIWLQEVQEL